MPTKQYLISIASLAFLIWIAAFGSYSGMRSRETALSQTQVSDQEVDRNQREWWNKWLSDPLEILTLAIALGTLASAYVAYRQIGITEQNISATQRAFVFLREFQVTPLTNPQNMQLAAFRIISVWENSGDTPTRRMVNYVSWQWLPREFDD